MNSKIIAAIVVVIVIAAAGVGVFFLLGGEKDKEINVLAAVNTEGSGIYIAEGTEFDSMFEYKEEKLVPIPSGWEGKVFGTPGTATIQHIQLMGLVEEMGFTFKLYTPGVSEPDVVYFDSGIPNATIALNTPHLDGGILWQPQYQKIVDDDKFQPLILTNELFPGHACCVIAGNHSYTSTHERETVAFLSAFVKATKWVNAAIANGEGSEDYELLVKVAKNSAGSNFTEQEIMDALATVTYHFGQDTGTPLAGLSAEISVLADDLYRLGVTKKSPQDLGFKNNDEFVKKFVDDSYLFKALEILDGTPEEPEEEDADFKVAVIAGDVHQIAVHMAKELGYFDEFGIKVSFSNATNGSGVATAIQNGEASFGLLGAPPLTTTVINGELVKA